MRQDSDVHSFMELSQRLRRRRCTRADFKLLQSRLIGSTDVPTFESPHWQQATFSVSRHGLRRELHRLRAETTARNEGLTLLRYAACYKSTDGFPTPLQLGQLQSLTLNVHDSTESKLYLHVKMPVVLNENHHTPQGITNGAYGTVVRIVLDNREKSVTCEGVRSLDYPPAQLFVKLKRSHPHRLRLSGLEGDVIVIEPRKARVTLTTARWTDSITVRAR